MKVRLALVAVVAVLLGLTAPASSAQVAEKQDGIAFTGYWNDAYDGQGPEEAMANLADTGAGWVSILAIWYQDSYTSTQIGPTDGSPTDAGVIHMIQTAHDLGLSVMLKPHVDLWNDPDHWRGQIGRAWKGHPAKWDRWFRSYRHFIYHFATLAQEQGVEQFAVGTELAGTIGKTQRWREIAAGVRQRFTGPLTYAATIGGEENTIAWWDAVDLIGLDAYYELTDKTDPTVQELEDGWTPYLQDIADLSSTWGDEPVLFTEVGFRSIDGANEHPWDWYAQAPIDLQEQADCYQATFASVWDQPWFAGMYWWDWSPDPTAGGLNDADYTPFGKPAEDVLRTWYA